MSPTGPKMLGTVMINNKQGINIDITHYDGGGYIIYKNVFIISTEYPEYNDERVLQNNKINKKDMIKCGKNGIFTNKYVFHSINENNVFGIVSLSSMPIITFKMGTLLK